MQDEKYSWIGPGKEEKLSAKKVAVEEVSMRKASRQLDYEFRVVERDLEWRQIRKLSANSFLVKILGAAELAQEEHVA